MSSNSEDFIRADSNNLPKTNTFMVYEYLRTNDCFNTAESSGAKAQRSMREEYGDSAIGYVQVKRDGDVCTTRCRVCPEHKVRSKNYTVSAHINEKTEEIMEVQCLDCAASAGTCKHALAFVMWLNRRSEEPSPTQIVCYWKRSKLASIGTSIKFIKASDFKIKNQTLSSSDKTINQAGFVNEVLDMYKNMSINISCPFTAYNCEMNPLKKLSLWQLLLDFTVTKNIESADNFLSFCRGFITKLDIENVVNETADQSNNPVWFDIRFGRITASKIHEVSRCKMTTGSLVEGIIGAAKIPDTEAMQRGRNLENDVIRVVQKKLNVKFKKTGFYILEDLPIVGASPDAITNEYVVEVKCPTSSKTRSNYIAPDGTLRPKCLSQIQLQMYAAGKKKGLFCIASPNFETSKEVELIWLDFNNEYITDVISSAVDFWKNNVFPLLLNSAKK